jgi:hypothetical protein
MAKQLGVDVQQVVAEREEEGVLDEADEEVAGNS